MHTFKVKTVFGLDDDLSVMTSVYTTGIESATRYAMAMYPEIDRKYWNVEQVPESVDAALIELIKRLSLTKCVNWSASNQVWENPFCFVYICGWESPFVAIDNFEGSERLYEICTPEEAKQVTIKH